MPADVVDSKSGVDYFTAATQLINAAKGIPKTADLDAYSHIAPIPFWENLFPDAAQDGLTATQRMAKADETTAEQKPKFNVTFGAEGFPTFSQQQLTLNSLGNLVSYSGALGYTFERGGRRDKRTTVAKDSTEVTRLNVMDSERQTRFQTEQAFIAALLAKSTLELMERGDQDQGATAGGNSGETVGISRHHLQLHPAG